MSTNRHMMMTVNQAVAARIKELLKKNGITRYRLAMKSGVPHSTLHNIMNNKDIDDHWFSNVILIASGFDMTLSEFCDTPLFGLENLNI